MTKKGLNHNFLHYGIREEDFHIIQGLCTEYQIDYDWLKEDILRVFHEKKMGNDKGQPESMDKILENIIEKALKKIK
jgi:hypothetical protein